MKIVELQSLQTIYAQFLLHQLKQTMKYMILTLLLFLNLLASQKQQKCQSTPLSMKLVFPANFVLYYTVDGDCSGMPKIDYCELVNCKERIRDFCNQYEISQVYDENYCKMECCMGISKVDMKLFNDIGCSAIDFFDKNETANKSQSESSVKTVSNNTASISAQNNTNNNSTQPEDLANKRFEIILLMISSVSAILVIPVIVCCCKCYSSHQLTSDIIQNVPQAEVNTQRALNSFKRPQQLKQKVWSLPDSQQPSIEMRLLEQECTICLNGHPNSSLDCGHFYHKECIFEWLKKVVTCPLCKSKKVNQLTVRCQKCLIYRYDCNLGQLKPSFATQDLCESCSKCEN